MTRFLAWNGTSMKWEMVISMATVTKRNNTYKITVSCGYDMNGRQIRRHMTWVPEPGMTEKQTEKELARQKVLFEERCRSGQVLDGNIRFADFAEKWFLKHGEKQLRPKTLARYRSMMPRINKAIGHVRLDSIKPHHLMAFYDNLGEAGVRDDGKYTCTIDFPTLLKEKNLTKTGFAIKANVSNKVIDSIVRGHTITKGSAEKVAAALGRTASALFINAEDGRTLAPKTILHHHRLISAMLSTAVQWQVIFANPCDRVKPPKVNATPPRYLDEEGAFQLLTLLEREPISYRTMISLLLYTGLRRGELLGLEWDDIDFGAHTIQVKRSSLYLPQSGIFEDGTKNDSSQRIIKAPVEVFTLLKEYHAWQIEERMKVGDRWQHSNRLFTTWNGRPMHPDTLTGWFAKFVKRNALPDISLHSLRHTNATLQIAGGVPLPTVAKRLGHANATTTTRVYAHAIRSADEAAAEILGDLLSPCKNSQ